MYILGFVCIDHLQSMFEIALCFRKDFVNIAWPKNIPQMVCMKCWCCSYENKNLSRLYQS